MYDELEVGGDELFKWVKSLKSEIVIEDDEVVQKLARSLIAKYSSPNRPKNGLNGADPFIIARAVPAIYEVREFAIGSAVSWPRRL